MELGERYLEVNKTLWNARVAHHIESEFYNNAAFLAGNNTLQNIELALLGDISGKRILHLQCHFGQDTLSLARLGAIATGVDISDKAIVAARELGLATGLNADFLCCDLYSLPEVHQDTYDIVFTSYGTIGWLPDMRKWAAVVAHFLRPGGQFVFAEFHPVIWMYDNDLKHIAYSYFNREPIIEQESGTYANKDAPLHLESIGWNHDLGEVLGALLAQDLQLKSFQEFDYSPFPCFSNVTEVSSGKYQIAGLEGKIPMVYALSMLKS